MSRSALSYIIKRLEIMQLSESDELRRFEADDQEKCTVRWQAQTGLFILHDLDRDAYYYFDNLDLVAIEIYELLG
ncbi:DUF1797 family protein [Eremococcus coleocola]|uniref:DUF1797 family protein n=1 Tax=Eremococcus coleocola TaxID=88132 RepID=UPI0004277F89|nr:DUF1797 family protein [Eremococcus coleocola]